MAGRMASNEQFLHGAGKANAHVLDTFFAFLA